MKATANSMHSSRRLRREMSLPEVVLWQRLRGLPSGLKFRRQHAIGRYVVDFYCAAAKLVIEIDGIAHDMGDRPVRDEVRDQWLKEQGLTILRIAARDVLDNADAVADSIVRLASGPSTTRCASGPPPHSFAVGRSEEDSP